MCPAEKNNNYEKILNDIQATDRMNHFRVVDFFGYPKLYIYETANRGFLI